MSWAYPDPPSQTTWTVLLLSGGRGFDGLRNLIEDTLAINDYVTINTDDEALTVKA